MNSFGWGLSRISGLRASRGPVYSATDAAQPGGYSVFTGSRKAQITPNYPWGGKSRSKKWWVIPELCPASLQQALIWARAPSMRMLRVGLRG
jgi:hypothetical protein